MAPVIPFIPLITAAVTAGGGIAASAIASRNSKAGLTAPPPSPLVAPKTSKTAKTPGGNVPINTSPLGDESDASLDRSRLLGN